jgi:FixJ family two-component response regulator
VRVVSWGDTPHQEAQRPFDLFVIDFLMPQMRGDEVGRQLHQGDPDATVLYVTGHSDQLFGGRNVLSKNEAFIEKPASTKALLEAVSASLFGHTGGRQGN